MNDTFFVIWANIFSLAHFISVKIIEEHFPATKLLSREKQNRKALLNCGFAPAKCVTRMLYKYSYAPICSTLHWETGVHWETLNTQKSTPNTQHPTFNTQHSTLSTQHSTLNLVTTTPTLRTLDDLQAATGAGCVRACERERDEGWRLRERERDRQTDR